MKKQLMRRKGSWAEGSGGVLRRQLARGLALLLAVGVAPLMALAEGAQPGGTNAPAALRLTLRDAVLLALERNPAIAVQRMAPAIVRTQEAVERAAFDPVAGLGASAGKADGSRLSIAGTGVVSTVTTTEAADLKLGVLLPSGASVAAGGSVNASENSGGDPLYAARAGVSATQPLLRGAGGAVTLASLRQARLETRMTQYEFRGFAEAFVAQVELACWDYEFARQRLDIARDALRLAEDQFKETTERISLGALSQVERYASEAEVALRRQAVINAGSELENRRIGLLRLLNAPGDRAWDASPEVVVPSAEIEDALPAEQHVQAALKQRPDLLQARLGLERNEIEVVKTRNGLLPRMDVFITLGQTGYADSFGGSLRGRDDTGYDALVGLSGEWPLGNRKAQALHERSTVTLRQSQAALDNLVRLAESDVRLACCEVRRSRDQIRATEATRRLQEEKLRAEVEKFRIGKSTTLLVAQAQQDVAASRLDEVQAVNDCRRALLALYRLDGSLLVRRGLDVPEAEAADSAAGRK